MKNEKILKLAEDISASKNFDQQKDFYIGCKVDEVLPNGKTSTLVCVDCSWLKQKPIINHDDLDEIDDGYKKPTIKIDGEDFILTRWMDMIDSNGDIHHCKVESFVDTSEDPFNPVERTSYAVYVEVV